MTVKSYIDSATGLSVTKLNRTVSKKELAGHLLNRIRAAEGENVLELVDGTRAGDLSISLNEFIVLADQVSSALARRNATAKFALVSDNSHIYGEFRMWQAACATGACDVRVFRRTEEAEEWLWSHAHPGAKPATGRWAGNRTGLVRRVSSVLQPLLLSLRG